MRMIDTDGVALLLIDIQNDFIDGSLAVKDSQSILPTVNSLISLSGWQMIVASQDAHPKNHISFASTHNLEPFQTMEVPHPTLNRDRNPDGEMVDQMLWPEHCLKGSRGYQLEKSVEQALEKKKEKKDCKIIYLEKGLSVKHDAYSAFSYNHYLSFSDLPRLLFSHPVSTTTDNGLLPNLNLKRISTIVLCGLATDYCLFSSAVDSIKFGFTTIVVLKGCKGVDMRGDGCQKEIKLLEDWGCLFMEVEEVEKMLKRSM